MKLPAGRNRALSPMRRTMLDFLRFSRAVPLVSMERQLHLGKLVAVRKLLHERPSWFALFAKAYALAAQEIEQLRQSYMTFPTAHLHQHACSVASITIVRELQGEEAVFFAQFRQPETQAITDLNNHLQHFRTAPLAKLRSFRRQAMLGKFPKLIRHFVWWLGLQCSGRWRAKHFGTFGITGVSALGATSLTILSPLTSSLAYGILDAAGSLTVRLFYDHRIMDGVQPALALERLEHHLVHSLCEELLNLVDLQEQDAYRRAA